VTWLTLDQFFAIGKQCALCEKKANWISKIDSKERPAYCDEHLPFCDVIRTKIYIDNPEDYIE